jgi:hypothetical protein
MKGLLCLALGLLAAFAVGPARAAAPLAAYGNLPMIEQIAISPSGKFLAIAFVKDEQRTIVVEDLALKKPVNGIRLGPTKLRGLEWAGDNHLILLSSFTGGSIDVMVDKTEWWVATDFNLATKKVAPLLSDADMTMNVVEGMPIVRWVEGNPTWWPPASTSAGGSRRRRACGSAIPSSPCSRSTSTPTVRR